MANSTPQREEFSFKFDGPAVERHEIEVSLLADSLLALRSLAERTCKMHYGKSDDLIVKVKADFKSGSFSVDLILDWIEQHPTTATVSAPLIAATIGGLFKLYKWAKGKKITSEAYDDSTVKVTNSEGNTNTYNIGVVNMYFSAGAKADAEKLTRPLEQAGVDSISLTSDIQAISVQIKKPEREYFQTKAHGVLREDEFVVTLEIVIANLQGGSSGWRFSDGSTEYAATIEDEKFLETIKTGVRHFRTGDMVEVIMKTVQRRPTHRLVTDRFILQVLTFIPALSDDEIEELIPT